MMGEQLEAWPLWEWYELYSDMVPVRTMVARFIGKDARHYNDFAQADTETLRGVQNVLEVAHNAWYERNDIPAEESHRVRKELLTLRARADARRIFDAEAADETRELDKSVAGGDAILDQPAGIPAVWGHDDEVLWACGEPFLLVAPPGVGKTTLIGQVVAGLLNMTDDNQVLGWHVNPAERILYIAADRPRQIKRSLRRHFDPDDHQVLNDRLVIWEGPPAVDLAKYPDALVELCIKHGASHVILDSLKDMAVGISDDAVGAGLNRAVQLAIAEGIEVAGLHHQRKGQNGVKPKTLEDVYGSTWITAGAGSVVLLWGQAGDPIVELTHLKQPASPVGPLKLEHDHTAGRTTVNRGFDALAYLRGRGPMGATSTDAARVLFDKSKPTHNEQVKARRRLDKLVDAGLAVVAKPDQTGGPGGAPSAIYRTVEMALTGMGESQSASQSITLPASTKSTAGSPRAREQETPGQSKSASQSTQSIPEPEREPPHLQGVGTRRQANGSTPTEEPAAPTLDYDGPEF